MIFQPMVSIHGRDCPFLPDHPLARHNVGLCLCRTISTLWYTIPWHINAMAYTYPIIVLMAKPQPYEKEKDVGEKLSCFSRQVSSWLLTPHTPQFHVCCVIMVRDINPISHVLMLDELFFHKNGYFNEIIVTYN